MIQEVLKEPPWLGKMITRRGGIESAVLTLCQPVRTFRSPSGGQNPVQRYRQVSKIDVKKINFPLLVRMSDLPPIAVIA